MADPAPLFRVALDQFTDAIRAAVTRVGIDDQNLTSFTDEFAADFSSLLSGPDGDSIWRRDGENVRQLGRYLGTIAEMYAVTEVPLADPATTDHLRRALAVIKPVCQLPLPPESEEQRREYCRGVSL